jgi:hypothetical protein
LWLEAVLVVLVNQLTEMALVVAVRVVYLPLLDNQLHQDKHIQLQ